jgi:WD40 repeat protein
MLSLAYSPDGRRALAGLGNGVMIYYDLETYQEIRRFGGNDSQTSFLFDVDFSPDGRLGLSTSGDGTLHLWDLESGTRLHRLVGHSGEVRMADFSPDGKWVASGARDETIILWDVATGEAIRRLRWAGSAGVFSLAFSPDGQYILAGDGFGQNSLWRVDSTLDSLMDWTRQNRYIPEPTCEERALYRLAPLCEDGG